MIHIDLENKILNSIPILDLHQAYVTDINHRLYKKLNEIKNNTIDSRITIICEYIIKNIREIAVGDIETLRKIRETFLEMVTNKFNFNKAQDTRDYKKFHKEIRELFESAYDDFLDIGNTVIINGIEKEWDAYQYIESLNIKICPYCHAQYINTIRNNRQLLNAGKQARPALDHFIPKSILPIFAVSLYNLIPACTYCNSYFKSDYYSTFETSYSPFEKDIEKHFKFKIGSVVNELNVFEKLKDIQLPLENKFEKSYLKLIGYTDKSTKDTIKKLVREIRKNLNDQNKLEAKINVINGAYKKDLFRIINDIKKKQNLWLKTIENYINKYYEKDKSAEVMCDLLVNSFNEYIECYNDFNLYKEKKDHKDFKTRLTSIRNLMYEVTKKVFAIEFRSLNGKENEKFNFVDANLGQTNDYMIQIIPEENCEDSIKRKVLSNIALFQLEGVYEQFKPYVNEKNKQLQLVNKVYLQTLVNDFPKIIDRNIVEEFSDSLFYTNKSYRDQILGKLIHDIFKPNVFSEKD